MRPKAEDLVPLLTSPYWKEEANLKMLYSVNYSAFFLLFSSPYFSSAKIYKTASVEVFYTGLLGSGTTCTSVLNHLTQCLGVGVEVGGVTISILASRLYFHYK